MACGLVPITVSTDLLRKGGYGRLQGYYAALAPPHGRGRRPLDRRVRAHRLRPGRRGAGSLGLDAADPRREACRRALAEPPTLRAAAGDEELFARWVSEARLLNTEEYVERATADPRYSRAGAPKAPRKLGSHLELFDCVTCDICVPVCPNDANFTLGTEQREIEVVKVQPDNGGWSWRREEPLRLERRHQIANFVDFCNDCGNCDVFCPEDGGPYVMKPRFFGHEDAWRQARHLNGFHLRRGDDGDLMLGRFGGREFRLEVAGGHAVFEGPNFQVEFDQDDPEATFRGKASVEIDLTFCHIMDYLRRAIFDAGAGGYVARLAAWQPDAPEPHPQWPPLPARD